MKALIDAYTHLPNYYIGNTGYSKIKVNGKDKLLHRWIAESVLGRELKSTKVVHHLNYDKLDCRKTNLLICQDQSYHKLIHARTDMLNKGVNPNTHHICSSCKQSKLKESFPKNRDEWNGVNHNCTECSNSIRKEKQYSKGKFNWLARLNQQYRRIKNSYTKRDICWITKEGIGL